MAKKKTYKKQKLIVKKVILKGKAKTSRKGAYWFIRREGQRTKYLKVRKGMTNKYLALKAYDSKAPKKRTPSEKYRIQKRPRIDTMITKGEANIEIKDIRRIDRAKLRNNYKKLMRQVVKEGYESAVDILSREENIKKKKHRLKVEVTIETGTKVSMTLKAYNKTISEVMTDFGRINADGVYEKSLESLKTKGWNLTEFKGMNLTGSPAHLLTKDVTNIKMRMVYTKGR